MAEDIFKSSATFNWNRYESKLNLNLIQIFEIMYIFMTKLGRSVVLIRPNWLQPKQFSNRQLLYEYLLLFLWEERKILLASSRSISIKYMWLCLFCGSPQHNELELSLSCLKCVPKVFWDPSLTFSGCPCFLEAACLLPPMGSTCVLSQQNHKLSWHPEVTLISIRQWRSLKLLSCLLVALLC